MNILLENVKSDGERAQDIDYWRCNIRTFSISEPLGSSDAEVVVLGSGDAEVVVLLKLAVDLSVGARVAIADAHCGHKEARVHALVHEHVWLVRRARPRAHHDAGLVVVHVLRLQCGRRSCSRRVVTHLERNESVSMRCEAR